MSMEEITFALFAACNSIRVVAYVPQILKAATDKNGASSISFMTWSLFLLANISTVAYALVNRSDWGLAACFATNAACCVAILAIAYWKRRRHAKRSCQTDRPALCVAA
jgi:PQ loop repeat